MITRKLLDELYADYCKRELVHPDPVTFLYNYENPEDRELVGLIASSLAYGRVAQIHKSVSSVLQKMGNSPYKYLMNATDKKLFDDFIGFKHRFTTDRELSYMLIGARKTIEKYGSLQKCFLSGLNKNDDNVLNVLCYFTNILLKENEVEKTSLLPCPSKGSACKRINLYLRWMVRKDNVDPGGWEEVAPSKLILPVDIHIHRFGVAAGFTARKNADMKAALEITDCFKKINPEDTVKYDFTIQKASIMQDKRIMTVLKT